jgi:putative FmdB family regulatory protein
MSRPSGLFIIARVPMPLYEYQCQNCKERLEVIQRMSDPPPAVCAKCGGEMKKLFSSPAIQFKGSGFYKTDYASASKSASSSSESGAESKSESKSDSKSDSKSETKAETKTETKAETKTETKSSSGSTKND